MTTIGGKEKNQNISPTRYYKCLRSMILKYVLGSENTCLRAELNRMGQRAAGFLHSNAQDTQAKISRGAGEYKQP